MREKLFRGVELDKLPEHKEGSVVADAGRLLHVVGDDDDSILLLELLNARLSAAVSASENNLTPHSAFPFFFITIISLAIYYLSYPTSSILPRN